MKTLWLALLLVPNLLVAQHVAVGLRLKAGHYHFLKFTSPIYLVDSLGQYQFSNCSFMNPDTGFCLVARRVAALAVSHSRFFGPGSGILVYNSSLSVKNCDFMEMKTGLEIEQVIPLDAQIDHCSFVNNKLAIGFGRNPNPKAASKNAQLYPLTIAHNLFHGNKTAIDLRAHNAPLPGVSDLWTDLNLRCNHFSPGNSNFGGTYTGLKLGNYHRLRFDAVSGDGTNDYDTKGPGANIWPLFGSVNRAILPCGQADVEEPCTLPAQNLDLSPQLGLCGQQLGPGHSGMALPQ